MPTFTLTGVITERFSGRPIEGTHVWVFPFTVPEDGGWPPLRTGRPHSTPSDASGRYSVSGLPAVGGVWVGAGQARDAFDVDYVQQCVTTTRIEGNTTLNLTVSSTADR
jgi:hypothetical protein